ncbi:MAG: hypothetical protein ACOY0T_41250 [Myxococcota bacterium]
MKTTRIVGLAALAFACSSANETPSPSGSEIPGGSPTEVANGSSAASNVAATSDSVAPARDDAAQFQARFAAVREVVGEAAAKRVMANADTQAKAVYQLNLASGNRVDFYEVLDGVPVVVEFGSAASSFTKELLQQKPSMSELFSILAPNRAVPSELVQLDARKQEMAPVYERLTAAAERYRNVALAPLASTVSDAVPQSAPLKQPGSESVGRVQFALTSTECFNKTWACTDAPGFDWRVAQSDRTSDSTISRSDTQSVVGIGCALSGLITYRVRYRTWWSWTTWFAYDMSAGQFTQPWHYWDNVLDFDFEGKLYNFQSGDKGAQCAAGSD